MKIKNFLRGRKTRWILPAAVSALLVAVMVPMALGAAADSPADTETVYKETAVERGDITVGITESGTASIATNSVYCDLEGAEIEEMYLKAGLSVEAGDAVASLTEQSVSSVLETYELALDTAGIKLSQAQTALTTGEVSAQSAYESSLLKKENAQNTYNETIENLNEAISSAQADVDDCTGTITYYETRLADNAAGLYTEYNIDELQAKLDAANAQVQADIASGYNDPASEHYTSYASDVQAQTNAQNDYDTAVSNYESEVTKETSELAVRKSGLSALRDKVTQAKLALETGTVEAQNQMAEDISAGDNAYSVYTATVASLQTSVDAAQTEYDTAQKDYDTYSHYAADPTVYSDYSGLVMSVGYSAGDTVSSMSALSTITDNSMVYVSVSVTQDDISDISVGEDANVSFSAYAETKFTGTVDSITITPAREESSTVSYTVTVLIEGDGVQDLYEGMTGDVTFVTKEVADVLYVSNKAITAEDGVQYAKVKDDAGNTTRVEVTAGFSDGQNTEILSGLIEGQTVLIESQAVSPE